jgi:glutamate-1-semialdehyde 2,1-aminomutase
MIRHSDAGTVISTSLRERNDELMERAKRVVPAGMYGHMFAGLNPPSYPQFFSRGEGCRVWDVDGNPYIDLMCGWGPMVLGHGDAEVEAAVGRHRANGDCLDGPSPIFVELAEIFVQSVPHADWAMFAKNGTDATTLAVRIARAGTGRDKVLMANGAYHGVASWCADNKVGIAASEQADTAYFEYNDLGSAEQAAASLDGELAAVIVCPMRHDTRRDLELVDPEFARGLRALCDRVGAALILDDVRCGMRFDMRGSWEPIGVRPDLSAWSKAIANGYPLAAVLGIDALREPATRIFTTGSFWFGGAAMAASLATMAALRTRDGIARMISSGERLREGLREQAASHSLGVRLSGPPQMPLLLFERDDERLERSNAFAGACIENGVFLHPRHNWFLSAAHDDEDIDEALLATDLAFAHVQDRFGAE